MLQCDLFPSERDDLSHICVSPRRIYAPHFPAVCSLWGQNQASAGSSLFLSHVEVIKISSITNCLCRRNAAFPSLIGNTQSSCEHHLALTSSASGGACAHVGDVAISFVRGNCPGRHLNPEVFQLFWAWLQAQYASQRLISWDSLTYCNGLLPPKCVCAGVCMPVKISD